MAIAVDTSSFVNSSSAADNFTVTLPASPDGKLGIIVMAQTRAVGSPNFTINESWTEIGAAHEQDAANREIFCQLFAKDMSGSQTNPRIDKDDNETGGWGCVVIYLTGATGTVGDLSVVTAGDNDPPDDDPELPSATVSDSGSMAIRGVALANDRLSSGSTVPTDHTSLQEQEAGAADVTMHVCHADADPSSIAAVDWVNTWDGTISSTGNIAFTLIVPPAAAAGTILPQMMAHHG